MKILVTDKDTICALATAHGIGAISVIRISGARAVEITRKIAAFLPEKLESHRIYYGFLTDLENGNAMDEVLVSYFQEGRSFTGEATLEISCHGSEAIVSQVLTSLVVAGARPAERGEFTYRAFMNGRLDLVQAESVLDLIQSRSSRASKMALRQLKGDFSSLLKGLLDQVTWVLANLEANIDFASEDIVIAQSDDLSGRLENILRTAREILATYRKGRIIRSGFQVALVGLPNAGKSSLLNALVGEERAIVTPVAGTTRDFVEAEVLNDGVRTTLVDTAGLRVTEDMVEKIGVQRSLEKLTDADLIVYVIDGTTGIVAEDAAFAEQIPWGRTVAVINKCDLTGAIAVPIEFRQKVLKSIHVSAKHGQGLSEFKEWLRLYVKNELSEDSTMISNSRHFRGLEVLVSSLEVALDLMRGHSSPDLVALELQSGLRALHEILGIVFDDQVMDRVFSEFCLGK